jgi:hypothetical protein
MIFHSLSCTIDPDVVTVLRAVPEFAQRYLGLAEAADGDPGAPAAFTELADFAAGLAARMTVHVPLLERCLRAVEEIAATSPEAQEHIGWAFLDSLSPEEIRALLPWLGPHTRTLLDQLESGPERGQATG